MAVFRHGKRTAMSDLDSHVKDYLGLRRTLGYKLERHGAQLPQFIAYLDAAGAVTVTSDLAIAWARSPEHARPIYWAQRLAIVRGFAAYLQTIEPDTEIPPPGVFPTRRHRATPYLWSTTEIVALLESARALRPELKAATMEALYGLLAVSGMRIGEAIGLERDDINLGTGIITIRHAKFDRPRLVPLHPTTVEALARYAATRDRLCPTPRSKAFFVSTTGAPSNRTTVDKTLRMITTTMGIRTAVVRPRAHDLRHAFAVATLRSPSP